MSTSEVAIKLSLDGAKTVSEGLEGVGSSADIADSKISGFVSKGLAGAGVALVGFGTAAVAASAALATGVVSSFAAYEQNIGGIETMFGDSAGKMQAFAQDAYRTSGLSANEYMSQATSFSAALLQGLGGDTEKAVDYANMAMVAMSDNANKFGTDIGSIQNAYQGFAKQNYTMLDNLKLGYGGTSEEMARLVNDAGLMEDGFTATAANINDVSYDKIIASISAVQDKMGITGTTLAEAEQTISGSTQMMKASFDNLLAGLGSSDADVTTLAGNVLSSVSSLAGNITPVIDNIGAGLTTLGPLMGEAVTSLLGIVTSMLPSLLSMGGQVVTSLISGIAVALPSLIATAVPILVDFANSLMLQLPLLISAGMQSITALVLGVAQALPVLIPTMVGVATEMVSSLVNNLPLFLDAALQLVTGLSEGLLLAIPVLIEALPALIDSILTFISGSIPQIIDAGIKLLVSLVQALPTIINSIVAALPLIITAVVGGLTSAIPQLIQAGVTLLIAIVRNMPAIISGVVSAIPAIISAIVSGISGGIGQVSSMGSQLIQGLWSGISNMTGWITSKISGFMGNITGSIKSFFGIASPSKLMRDEIGKYLPEGMAVGIDANTDAAIDAMSSLGNKVTAEAKTALDMSITPLVNPSSNLDTTKYQQKFNPISTAVSMMPSAISPKYGNQQSFAEFSNKLDTLISTLEAKEFATYLDGHRISKELSPFINRRTAILTNQAGRGVR